MALVNQGFSLAKLNGGKLDFRLDPLKEKVVVYGTTNAKGQMVVTHAERQTSNGKYRGKLGRNFLIEHNDPTDVNCTLYGEPIAVYEKSIAAVGIVVPVPVPKDK